MITVGLSHFHFQEGCDCTDWAEFAETAFPASASTSASTVSAAGLTPGQISALVTSAVSAAKYTPDEIGKAVGAGYATAAMRPHSSYTFNVLALPTDVQDRFTRRRDNKPVLKSHTEDGAHFVGGNRYHLDPPNRLICLDGTLCVFEKVPDEKGLLREPILCRDDTYQGLRTWYDTFMRHAIDHSFYVHPLWCFRKDHGGNWGFTVGDDASDDIPGRYTIPVQAMSAPIYRLLQKPDMFPKNSKIVDIVQGSRGDGYLALKQIIFAAHPAFHDQPATLITAYPKQRTLSMLKYRDMFVDYLQLRAIICDQDADLKDEHEMDIFIGGTLYNEWLTKNTREERKDSTYDHKYTANQIVETLETFLNLADSPATIARRKKLTAAARQSSPAKHVSRSPVPVNVMERGLPPNTSSNDSDDSAVLISNSSGDTQSIDHLQAELENLTIPDDLESKTKFAQYTAAIYKIEKTGNFTKNQKCLVCDGIHRFDGCPVLLDTTFLKNHYIRYCQSLKKEQLARQAAFGTQGQRAPSAHVNFVDVLEGADLIDLEDYPDDSSIHDEDFQRARR